MGADLLLVGCGKMGGAMLAGWVSAGVAGRVVVVEPQAPQGLPEGVEHAASAEAIPEGFDPAVVILAVKPQIMDGVLPAYRRFVGRSLFLSIAAGKPVEYFERQLGASAAIVRAMPNTPAAVGRGISAAFANGHVTPEGRVLSQRLLESVSEVAWLEEEGHIDAVTALSGSGPAYVFLTVEVMARAGVAAGLPEALSMQLARATVAGAGELLHRSPESAEQLRRNVTSPNGTTQAALEVLMAPDGIAPVYERAVAAGTRRSRELAG